MINEFIDEGVINLSIAIVEAARQNYENHLDACNYIQARICAQTDSKGIVGSILEYTTGDREFMLKEIEKRISSQLERGD